MNQKTSAQTAPIYLLFFLSGATGLIYELLWVSRFGRLFGNSSYAIGTVLAAYMGGLAIGSWLIGNRADRFGNTLRVYAILEALIAITALLVPALLWIFKPFYIALSATRNPAVINVFRLVVSLLVLLPPTLCMGGTLPVLVKHCTRNAGDAGHRLGVLYSLNTFGAVAGTLLAGLVLLPAWGERLTLLTGVIINVSIFIIAWILSAKPVLLSNESNAPSGQPAPESAAPFISPAMTAVLLFALAIAGFASMGFEIVWSRLVALILGSSVYAFTAMLSVFLTGLAIGSALAGSLLNHCRPRVLWFTLAEIGIAGWILLTMGQYESFTTFIGTFNKAAEGHFGLVLSAIFLVCAFMVLIPAIFMGSAIPLVMATVNGGRRIGHYTGLVYATNTLGGILGSLVAGFALAPLLGIQHTLVLCLTINLIAAALSLLAYRKHVLFTAALVLLGVAAIAGWRTPAWDPVKMSTGAFLYGPQENFNANLLFAKDGVSCSVSVEEYPNGTRTLRVNGKADASTELDMSNQIMTGLLAMLFKPDAERVLVVGYGSGVSVGAVLHYDVKSVDCAELEKRVIEADPYFNIVNHSPLSDPRLAILVEDGRNIIETARVKYDVIVSEPSNPWMAGIADLFTRDYYNKCLDGLTPDGVMCQWLQAYKTSLDDFKTICRTFSSVFPHHALYKVSSGDFLLLGSRRPLVPDLMAIQKDFMSKPLLAEDLRRYCTTDDIRALLTRYFIMDNETLDRFCKNAPRILTDAHNTLGYTAVQNLFGNSESDTNILNAIFSTREMLLPKDTQIIFTGNDHALSAALLNTGDNCLEFGNIPLAEQAFELALRADPRNERAAAGLLKVMILAGKPPEAIEPHILQVMNGDPSLAHEVCRWLFEAGQIPLAARILEHLTGRFPDSSILKARLASAWANLGRDAEAVNLLKTAAGKDPLNEDISALLMLLESRQ
ncbi:MAG: fused MFS/spermidine synthase [Kiritimatiellia bacterium]